jgi:hypothetical protein
MCQVVRADKNCGMTARCKLKSEALRPKLSKAQIVLAMN